MLKAQSTIQKLMKFEMKIQKFYKKENQHKSGKKGTICREEVENKNIHKSSSKKR